MGFGELQVVRLHRKQLVQQRRVAAQLAATCNQALGPLAILLGCHAQLQRQRLLQLRPAREPQRLRKAHQRGLWYVGPHGDAAHRHGDDLVRMVQRDGLLQKVQSDAAAFADRLHDALEDHVNVGDI